MLLTFLIVFIYFGGILSLYLCRILDQKDLISNLTIAFGWIVALLIALIHIKRAKTENERLKKEEIKKKLEIDAFKEINKAINGFSNRITSIYTLFFYTLPCKLKNHIQNPVLFKFDPIQIDREIGLARVNLYQGNTNFLLSIESNEIAVIEYDHYRKYINFKTDDLYRLIEDFILYFTKTNKDALKQEKAFLEFKKKCDQINKLAQDILSYLFDYRIILMNSMLKEIFDKSVPSRKPKDPKYKILSDVAIKGEVEKEEERRIEAAIKRD